MKTVSVESTPFSVAGSLRRYAPLVGSIALLAALQLTSSGTIQFPESWYGHLADPIGDFQGWIRANNQTNWFFRGVINPGRDAIDWVLTSIVDTLLWLPWFTLPALSFGLVARAGRWGSAVFVSLVMLFPGLVGLWEPTMETLALMAVSVGLCVVIGVPLGIWSARNERIHSAMAPALDAMQTIPTTAYLLLTVLVLSIGEVPAAVATMIYALPPIVRLTDHGIRTVPVATVEAARVFGSSSGQILRKVQLPQAVPSIVTGINQTINMALGIVVIAALVGAGGLGQAALDTLRLRSPGRGFVVGGALVALAIVLDRVSRSFIERPRREQKASSGDGTTQRWTRERIEIAAFASLAVAVIAARIGGWIDYPVSWGTDFATPIDDAIVWIRDNGRWLTSDVNDFIVRDLYLRQADFLNESVAWPVLVVGSGLLGWWAKGVKLAIFCAAAVFTIGLLGQWEPAVETLVQVVIAVIIAAFVAVPIGIWTGRRPRLEQALGPALDALQTIPALTYAIPFVMIFSVGMVPGLIAAVLYAIPPGIRLTALGIRSVPVETLEAATTFGATKRDLLWDVRLPLALPAIMLAVNQVILMVVAMVIISGLTGSGALGFLIVETFTRGELGRGAEVAIALTLMALVLDRLMQAVADRFKVPAASH